MIPEEMLRTAAAGAWERYYARLTAEYAPGQTFPVSEAFEKKIRKLMRRADHPVLYRTLKRVAIILLTLLIAGTVWLSIDTDARAAVFGWFSEIIGDSFIYHHNKSTGGEFRPVDYRPLWIPDGYTEEKVNVFADEITVLYYSETKGYLRFSYIVTQEKRVWYLDASDTELKECRVKDQPAQMFVATKENVASGITWTTDDSVFACSGFVTEAELLKMAESVVEIPPDQGNTKSNKTGDDILS